MSIQNYFLTTARLGFRWWTPEDFPIAFALWGDIKVSRLLSKEPWAEADVRRMLNADIENAKLSGVQYWPIFKLEDNENIGCCGLRPYLPDEMIYLFGCHLRTIHWGKGFASEAAKAIVDYAFSELKANGLFTGHHPDNIASAKALRKLGFEKIEPQLYEPTGLIHPNYILKVKSTSINKQEGALLANQKL